MSTVPDRRHMTRDEYLAFERTSETKHEFLDGEVFAMSGASRRHNLVSLNIARRLLEQLDGKPCETYINDMRVRVQPTGLYTYPDVVVACDNPEFESSELDTLLTPTVVIEVLSESTKDYDRGGKWKHYRQIKSLRHYLLVSQDAKEVEMYTRNDDGSWRLTDHQPPEVILIDAIDCHLSWDDLYARVKFDPPTNQEQDAPEDA